MSGFKRDRTGNVKRQDGPSKPAPKLIERNAFTPMFEHLRDELDSHHDRRDRLGKASRDITALSKKIIFSLQRVRKIEPHLPPGIQKEIASRLAEIATLLSAIAPEVQGINRLRYGRSLVCLEELVEALTFQHYLKTQTLIKYDQLNSLVEDLSKKGSAAEADVMASSAEHTGSEQQPSDDKRKDYTVGITEQDYLYGVLDLTGEMMRFATTASALSGKMASSDLVGSDRDIVHDMHELGTFLEMLPPRVGSRAQWVKKLEVTRDSVKKVEKLGYDLKVRGSERPKGWVPDLASTDQPGSPE